MYRRVLVPLDGGRTSRLGLKHALGLAKDQHARVRFLNVMDQSLGITGFDVGCGTNLEQE
jgi:nucleotide-binding universal stress UspA family protein